jgi:hypothetical protein
MRAGLGQPGHVEELRHDALQRIAITLDCLASVHRRLLLRSGAGIIGEVEGGVEKMWRRRKMFSE